MATEADKTLAYEQYSKDSTARYEAEKIRDEVRKGFQFYLETVADLASKKYNNKQPTMNEIVIRMAQRTKEEAVKAANAKQVADCSDAVYRRIRKELEESEKTP